MGCLQYEVLHFQESFFGQHSCGKDGQWQLSLLGYPRCRSVLQNYAWWHAVEINNRWWVCKAASVFVRCAHWIYQRCIFGIWYMVF